MNRKQQPPLQSLYGQLRNYTSDIQSLLGRVTRTQIDTLSEKYHYFLTKLDKQNQQHKKLLTLYKRVPSMIQESVPVIEQTKSICFIIMISLSMKAKLNQLAHRIEQLTDNNQKYKSEINQLIQQLKTCKHKFFQLKRQELEQRNFLISSGNRNKLRNIRQTSKEIAKSQRINGVLTPLYNLDFDKNRNSYQPKKLQIQLRQSLNFIDEMKENLLSFAKQSGHPGSRIKNRFTSKNRLNKIRPSVKRYSQSLFKTKTDNFPLKKSEKKQDFKDSELMLDETRVQCFLYTDKVKKEFMQLSSEDVIKMVLRRGKIDELMQLIESQKKSFVQGCVLLKQLPNY